MTEPTNEPAPGIDEQIGAGVTEKDQGAEQGLEDGRGRATLRTDPDDPEEGMREAQEASEEAD